MRSSESHKDSSREGRIRTKTIPRIPKPRDQREAQLAWTLCVSLAVLLAALYHLGAPKNFLSSAHEHTVPDAVRTGSPLIPLPERKSQDIQSDNRPLATFDIHRFPASK